jgi:hypothetical protein
MAFGDSLPDLIYDLVLNAIGSHLNQNKEVGYPRTNNLHGIVGFLDPVRQNYTVISFGPDL